MFTRQLFNSQKVFTRSHNGLEQKQHIQTSTGLVGLAVDYDARKTPHFDYQMFSISSGTDRQRQRQR